jgi:hypothetical protein
MREISFVAEQPLLCEKQRGVPTLKLFCYLGKQKNFYSIGGSDSAYGV